MKTIRFFSVVIGLVLSMSVLAQSQLTEDGSKAQKALIEYLRANGVAPSIDTRDNSVCFKRNDVFYWVTFDEKTPVLYTIHRKGLKFDEDPAFKPSCARVACNEVNRKHEVKCTYNGKRIEFVLQAYAKDPSDFHGGFSKMLAAFEGVETTFKDTYEKAFDAWKKDSIAKNEPIAPQKSVEKSPLTLSDIAFANFDAEGNVLADYNQPLRRSECRFIRASVFVSSSEKGIFKLAIKITAPNGKEMVARKGFDYASTANVTISKTNKPQQCDFGSYGEDNPDFWEPGEYKVEFYDYETGTMLHTASFNLL